MYREIERPYLWLGVPVNGTPKPWQEFRWNYGLMPNAYQMLLHPSSFAFARRNGIGRHIGFRGRIALDSGGYQFTRKDQVGVLPGEILDLYQECRPDYGVVLDHPLGPGISRLVERSRQSETLSNTRYMQAHRREGSPVLIPVIHGHSPQSLSAYIRKLKDICDPPLVGIGSIVPSIYSTGGAAGTHQAIRALAYVRRQLPDKILHVFGVGSIMTMHLMYYAGFDSVDSSAWRLKAAYGAIQLPGVCDRNLTGKALPKKYKRLSRRERGLLNDCRCPICRSGGIASLRRSFSARAIHNAWVYQQEVDHARRLMRAGEYDEYVEKTVGANPKFSRILQTIQQCRQYSRSVAS